MTTMLEQLTIADFAGLEGKSVTLQFGDTEQAGEVIEVCALTGGKPDGREAFSVVVRSGPVDPYWPQGTYILDHPRHGPLKLFLVPIGPDETGMRYEINFS
jgi:hypothetical protein